MIARDLEHEREHKYEHEHRQGREHEDKLEHEYQHAHRYGCLYRHGSEAFAHLTTTMHAAGWGWCALGPSIWKQLLA